MAQPARSSIVFTSFSPSATSIGVVMPSISRSSSCDAQFGAAVVVLLLDPGEVVLGAGLDLGAGLLVEPLDRGQLLDVDVGDLLDVAEAFRGEQLADRLVHVERAP